MGPPHSGNGLTIAYTSYDKTASITRGTTSIGFDPGLRRATTPSTSACPACAGPGSQMGPSGTTLYLAGGGVFAERFAGLGGGG